MTDPLATVIAGLKSAQTAWEGGYEAGFAAAKQRATAIMKLLCNLLDSLAPEEGEDREEVEKAIEEVYKFFLIGMGADD